MMMARTLSAAVLWAVFGGAAHAQVGAPADPAGARAARNSAAAADHFVVRVENPLPLQRPDETIALPWRDVVQHAAGVNPRNVRVLGAAGVEQAFQVVDADGDGQPDQLLFQGSFAPHEVREFRVEAGAARVPVAARAYVKHEPYRDDVAWETDRIGYRMYGQGLWNASEYQPLVSSGIDVWPKRVRDLIVERWYEKGHDAYHIDTGEGADFYTVGPTLGAGGTAIWHDGRLHRARNFKTQRILANGPIRVIFELHYEPWDAGGVTVSEVKRISMDAGQNLFRQDITYTIQGGDQVEYAVGTVKREGLVGSTSRARDWAWQSTWGPVERKNGGHGSLGTAVLMERARLTHAVETDDHYLVRATARDGETVTQFVGAGWTASGDFAGVEAWWAYLDAFAQRLEQPLRITIQPGR